MLQWYILKLLTDQKFLIKYGNKIIEWEKQLLKRVKIAFNHAIMVIKKKKYIVDNTQKQKEHEEDSAKIMQATRDGKLLTLFQVFFLIYKGMDAEF